MREFDFLPSWYSAFLSRKRLLKLQVFLTLLAVGGLFAWWQRSQGNLRRSEAALVSLKQQVADSRAQAEHLARLEALRKQWKAQAEVLSRLGLHVESARLLGKLADALPDSVALLSIELNVDESPMQLSAAQRALFKDAGSIPLDRRLKVKLQGVAPTDVEVVNFLTAINRVGFFERVAPTYARDRRELGRVFREFELTFEINLNAPVGL